VLVASVLHSGIGSRKEIFVAGQAQKKSNSNPKIDLPLRGGTDLSSAGDRQPPLNRGDKKPNRGHVVSGSSNREGGYDMHPHKGDHGEAQKAGSPKKSDYDGEDALRPDDEQPGPT
jgi:hypothetical protein